MISYDESGDNRVRIVFHIPTRCLIGFHREFKHDTHGTGVIQQSFLEYGRHRGALDTTRKGALVSTALGECTAYALEMIEPRGRLFVGPGAKTYSGMIIGEHSREEDLEVNPVKEKHLTNIRMAHKEEFFRLTPPLQLTLEWVISYIQVCVCVCVSVCVCVCVFLCVCVCL